ncbi:MAG TPA: hypothetical protein VM368_02235, partial [Flavisolibacter sp.]|nr:hypothetical protein [Flavisolibacter sp.]
MRKLLLLNIFFIIGLVASSQITTNLVVNPTPTAVLSDWYNNRTIITYVVTVQSAAGIREIPAVIKAELRTTDGTLVATTDLSKAPVFILTPG